MWLSSRGAVFSGWCLNLVGEDCVEVAEVVVRSRPFIYVESL
jgi:hypothetical protein